MIARRTAPAVGMARVAIDVRNDVKFGPPIKDQLRIYPS